MKPCSCGFPGLDVTAVKKKLTLFDASEGVSNIDLSSTDGFHLRAFKFHTSFVGLKNVIFVTGFSVFRNLVTHRIIK